MKKKDLKTLKEALKLENKSIEQFEEIAYIMRKEATKNTDALNKVIEVLEYLKIDDDIIDSIDIEGLVEIVNYFTKDTLDIDTTKVKNTIEINGRKYVCEEYNDFKLKGRYLALVFEKLGSKDIASFILAVIFKDEALTATEHRDINHIKHKQSLFKSLLVKDYYPYVAKVIHDVVIANTEIIKNRVESDEFELG